MPWFNDPGLKAEQTDVQTSSLACFSCILGLCSASWRATVGITRLRHVRGLKKYSWRV